MVQVATHAGDGLPHVMRTQERTRADEREAAAGPIGRPRPARDHFEMALGTRVPIAYVAAIEADGGVHVTPTIVRILIEHLWRRLPWLLEPLAHLLVLKAMPHATDARPHGLGVQALVGGQHLRQQLGDAREGNEARQLRLQIQPFRRDQASTLR